MAESETPDCSDESDKPLLPKWFAWTWPCTWYWWVLWAIGFFLVGYGTIFALFGMMQDYDGGAGSTFLIIIAIGTLFMGCASPNPFRQMMDGYTFGSDPESWSANPKPPMDDDDWHLYRGYWDEEKEEWVRNELSPYEQDFPNINISQDGDEYIVYCEGEKSKTFATQKEASDHMTQEIKNGERRDVQELLFGDHPRHNRYRALFNATPPQFTTRFLFHAFSVLFILGAYLATPTQYVTEYGQVIDYRAEIGYLPIVLMIVGALSTIISHYSYRSSVEAWDTVTSIIKYADGGHGELVGQIRPLITIPQPILHVDGCTHPKWTFDDLVAWFWSYDCTETWTERYYDHESKTWKTRTRTETRRIRYGGHTTDFMVHDGTGGMAVKLTTFERVHMGSPIWNRKRRGDKTCGPYASARHGGSLKHNWSLTALRKGDPTYIMARIKSRHHDEIPKGNVGFNATRVHHTLEAVGEDAPRRRAKVSKGNEFSVLSAKNSSTSRLGPWVLLIVGAMALMLV